MKMKTIPMLIAAAFATQLAMAQDAERASTMTATSDAEVSTASTGTATNNSLTDNGSLDEMSPELSIFDGWIAGAKAWFSTDSSDTSPSE